MRKGKRNIMIFSAVAVVALLVTGIYLAKAQLVEAYAAFKYQCGIEETRDLRVDYLSTGATLLRDAYGNRILIDTCSRVDEPELVEQLETLEVSSIDYLILTNKSEQRIGSADLIVREYGVEAVYTTTEPKDSVAWAALEKAVSDTGAELVTKKKDDAFRIGDICFLVTATDNMLLRASYFQSSFLFGSDATKEETKKAVSDYDIRADIVLATNRGAARMIDTVSPQYVVSYSDEFNGKFQCVAYNVTNFGILTIKTTGNADYLWGNEE